MKKIKYFILATIMLFSSVSCNDFLQENTFGEQFVEDLVTDELSAVLFVYSMYDALFDQYQQYFYVWDTGTDDQAVRKGSSAELATGMANANLTTTTSNSSYFWDDWWVLINRANFIIDTFAESDELVVSFINNCVAEARCMRAFAYFNLVRIWGDVPMVDWFVERDNFAYTEGLERTSVAEIYEKIIFPDLEFASENGADTQTMKGRATKWFAKTILAEAYMTYAGYRVDCNTGKYVTCDNPDTYWSKAREMAKDVLDNCTTFSLIEDGGNYESAYARIWEEEWNSETIMEVGAMAESGYGNYRTWAGLCKATYGTFWGSGPVFENEEATVKVFGVSCTYAYCIPTPDLFHAFEDGDDRKWGMLTNYVVDEGTSSELVYTVQPCFYKFIDINTALEVTGTDRTYDAKNVRLYRYADAMLIFAEADNEVNGPTQDALEQINRLRRRASLEDITSMGSQDEWRETIHHERRIELHGENKRRHDLVRWGQLSEKTHTYDTYYELEDNPIKGDINLGSNMAERGIGMYLSTTIHYAHGCETYTQLPLYAGLMCLTTTMLDDNDNWNQNYGY